KTAIHTCALQQAKRSSVAVGQNRLRVLFCDSCESRGYRIECFVPGNTGEPPFAFSVCPLHWIKQALRMVGTLLVMRDLDAESAMGERICGITCYADRTSMFIHLDEHRTRIGTVMGTDGADNSGVAS